MRFLAVCLRGVAVLGLHVYLAAGCYAMAEGVFKAFRKPKKAECDSDGNKQAEVTS